MSVSAVSSGAAAQAQSLFQQQRDLFNQLQQSLNSGDVSSAQQAFKSLQQLLPAAQFKSTGQNGGNSQLQQDFDALGQALQSGDLTAAQDAFKTLKQDLQAARQAHAHQQAGSASATDSDGDNDGSGGTSVQVTDNGQTVNITV